KAYLRRGQTEKFRKTIETLFQSPASEGPIYTREQIVTDYSEEREWAAAKICAQVAAEQGEFWAPIALADCCEALQEWKQAEQYFRAVDQQRGSMYWYEFTLRTGKGDKESARAAARELIDGAQLDVSDQAQYAYANGDRKEALRLYEIKFAEQPNPYYGLMVALQADELKESDKRDAALRRTIEDGPRYRRRMTGEGRPELIALARAMASDLAGNARGEIDHQWAIDTCKSADAAERMNFNNFLG